MNKADTILERLKNQPQPVIDRPDDLTDSIMGSLPEQNAPKAEPARRMRLYVASAIAVAASTLLLLVFLPREETVEKEPLAAIQQTVKPTLLPPAPPVIPPVPPKEDEVKPVAAAKKNAVRKKPARKRIATDEVTATPTAEPITAESSRPTTITPNPAEQLEREFREQAEFLRRRGEQVMLRAAALNQQLENGLQYVEL